MEDQPRNNEPKLTSQSAGARSLFVRSGLRTREWVEDKAPQLGAALAYYTVFSLAPLILVLLAIVGVLHRRSLKQMDHRPKGTSP